jgi:serine/threonine-protein kinase
MNDPSTPAKGTSGALDPMIGRVIDGRYRINSLLAIGGMGRVYKAEQSGLGRTVAIKILAVDPSRQSHDPHFRERFALEAATASRLTSPHTITIFHFGRTDDDVYYIVMEYVEGNTLGHVLKRDGRIPIARAIAVARQVCLSLREAHARGIVHRDIKPSNVILVNGDYDQVKVLDFGIAKHVLRESDDWDRELTSSGSYIGTPEYMSPEIIDGKVDARADIYAVGVMLYRAVTGRLPFKGKTATQTILMALRDQAPPIDPSLGVPLSLEELILACLERDPDHRPASVDEVLRGLAISMAEVEEEARLTGQSALGSDIIPIGDARPPESTGSRRFPPGSIAAGPPPPAQPIASPMARAARIIFAGAVVFAVGCVATAFAVRFARSRDPVVAPVAPVVAPVAPPVQAVPLPAAAATPAAVASQPGSPPARAEAPADPPAAKVRAAEPADDDRTDRPANRRAVRRPARGRPERAKATSSETREPAARTSKPADPVPDGYKSSPY